MYNILETPFQCQTCEKRFVRKDKLSKHEETHKTREETKTFAKTIDGGKTEPVKVLFGCNKCEKKYTRKSHLQLHELTHSDGLTAVCDYCGKKFLRDGHVQRHKTIHRYDYATGECTCLVCERRFPKDELKSHMM